MRKYLSILYLFFVCGSLFSAPKSEMRAVWIATVANIDWPSKKGDTEAQKRELITMLDSLKTCNINAVIFQARPSADALYKSDIEPWSQYLTGTQGKAPYPLYDPLEFIITEAHKRCMEVHVWINPYRLTNGESVKTLSKDNVYFKRPHLFKKYGTKYFFDPGREETMNYLVSVVKDIVKRYDIDALHFDDYFYPYKVSGVNFDDDDSFYSENRGVYDRLEWRRNNVNMVIEKLSKVIKEQKPWVVFGISPFGIWRNLKDDFRGSQTVTTCTNYDELYADVLTWLEKGWIDYVAPQLYWEIGKKNADYEMLTSWWSEYSFQKNLYIGLYASGLSEKKNAAWKRPNELIRQMRYNRTCSEVQGEIFFSATQFLKNMQGLLDSLKNGFYKYPALPPSAIDDNNEPSAAPHRLKIETTEGFDKRLSWNAVKGEGGQRVSYYIVYHFEGVEVGNMADPANILAITPNCSLDLSKFDFLNRGKHTLVVTSFNRYRKESEPSLKLLIDE